MLVELDLFSGRPNPRWRLDPGDAEEFCALTAGLPPAGPVARPQPQLPSPGLGYRGFTVTDADRVIHVFAGRVTEGTTSRTDRDRSLERWLLTRLPSSLHDLRSLVAEALDAPSTDGR
ncbi:hypothetical protein [Streptomyces hiroshimensis]|uniref:Uncharacterized protein n=1 Tax=Streptomyces hiroshimensis TaxID=66424 RepID=A0ABQ2Y9C7_9ACTN|nr:hypothetical protein [Streptomyces hiroshimensis]GGX74777.1 hypothetical protein GCM10010324_20170 [Streptomyces hiroshimensis]